MKPNSHILVVGTILFLTVAQGCFYDIEEMSTEEKYAVDTIYNRKLISWRTELDSFCSQQRDTLFLKAVDSLKKERLSEIEMLINEPTLSE